MNSVQEWIQKARTVNPLDADSVIRLAYERPRGREVWKRHKRAVDRLGDQLEGMVKVYNEMARVRREERERLSAGHHFVPATQVGPNR